MAIKLNSYRSRLMEKLVIPSEAKHYINAALEDSTEMFFEAIKDVAQAHRVAAVAKQSGVTRESLYRSLSKRGNPSWKTVLAVLKVVGLTIPGVEEARPSSKKTVPTTPVPVAASFGRAQSRSFVTRRAVSQKKTTYAQMRFDFTPSASAPMPAVQQSPSKMLEITTNPTHDAGLPAAYICNMELERDYGYTRAFNASSGNA
jgi:probable addiction module antidote protein